MASIPAEKRAAPRTRRAAFRTTSGRYWVCLTLLAAAAVAVQIVPHFIGVYLRKEAVPLLKPLQLFDLQKLAPRYARHPDTDRIKVSEELEDSLGTPDYLLAYVTDTYEPLATPKRVAHLFVTYYTGKPDMVPHVPDECYLASGFDPVNKTTAKVRVPGVGAPNDEVPVRVVQFQSAQARRWTEGESGVITVMYFFHANGGYATTRNQVRTKMLNLFQRYAYFSKIEVTIPNTERLPLDEALEASLEALEPVLEAALPVLLREHFDLSRFPGSGPDQPARKQ